MSKRKNPDLSVRESETQNNTREVNLDRPVREFTTNDEKYCSCIFFTNAGKPPRSVAYMLRRKSRFGKKFSIASACKSYSYRGDPNPPVSVRCIYSEGFLNSLSTFTLIYFIIKKKIKISEETKRMLVKEILEYFKRLQEYIQKMRREKEEEETGK
jgi:hypothetical protein